jgi:hypothetical protein
MLVLFGRMPPRTQLTVNQLCWTSLDLVHTFPYADFISSQRYSDQAPSRWHLLLLDSTIVALQWLLVTIAYEAFPPSQSQSISPASSSQSATYLTFSIDVTSAETKASQEDEGVIMDITVHDLIRRLRAPAPTREATDELPLPNTTGSSLPLPAGLRLLLRARAEMHRRTQMAARENEAEAEDRLRTGRIPGTMDSE